MVDVRAKSTIRYRNINNVYSLKGES
ncbi:hypothetical protein SBBP2_1860005 [Burkholderiales bacterium]|nr:hypothetical protein SBBP2_1860005 [Burkholderiales bacterium]